MTFLGQGCSIADVPNINEVIWRNLNKELQSRNHKGLKGKKSY